MTLFIVDNKLGNKTTFQYTCSAV